MPNLQDKQNYTTHYRNHKLYLELGLRMTKVHRVLAFDQSAFMKAYIDKNTDKRKQAKDDFEKDFFKLLNNSVFGKTMENVREHIDLKLVTNQHRLKKLAAKPNCKFFERINDELALVNMGKQKVLLNKPIYVGFSILEVSKTLMYDFHYNKIMRRYGAERATLLFTDTDSLCYKIQTENLYEDMHQDRHFYDTSNYPAQHKLFSTVNGKVLGKFKDETASVPPIEFVGLKAKMYSLLVTRSEPAKVTAKGVKRSWVDKNLTHENFKHVLENRDETYVQFYKFTSKRHTIRTSLLNKKCLDAYDDKRYLLDDGVTSLSYGHRDIPDPPAKRRRLC